MKNIYRSPDGTEYPLTEALYPIAFTVYRTKRNKAVIGDPGNCILANAIKDIPGVHEAHVGSGNHAYVVFKAKADHPANAVHFIIRAQAASIRDAFETNKKLKSQVVLLHAPTASTTQNAMAKKDRDRHARDRANPPAKRIAAAKALTTAVNITRADIAAASKTKVTGGVLATALKREAAAASIPNRDAVVTRDAPKATHRTTRFERIGQHHRPRARVHKNTTTFEQPSDNA